MLNWKKTGLRALLLGVSGLLWSALALAGGYHYQVDVSTTFKQDAAGRLNALQMEWVYGQAMTELLVRQEDLVVEKRAAALKTAAGLMMKDLQAHSYFTRLNLGGELQQVVTSTNYALELTPQQRLRLRFLLPLVRPIDMRQQQLALEMLDPKGTAILLYTDDSYVNADAGLLEQCDFRVDQKAEFEHGEAAQTVQVQCH